MVAPIWDFDSGEVKVVRVFHRRHFFKSFAILQVRRDLLRRQSPFSSWEVFGLTGWRDVNPNDLPEVTEVMNLLEKINETQVLPPT